MQAKVSAEILKEWDNYRTWLKIQPTRTNRQVAQWTVRKYSEFVLRLIRNVGLDPAPEGVAAFVSKVTEGKKNSTYNQWFNSLNSYGKFREASGRSNGYIKYLRMQSTSDEERRPPLHKDELDRLVAAAVADGDESFAFYLRVAWDTLARATELLNVVWDDIKFGKNPVSRTDAVVTFRAGKTGKNLVGYIWTPGLADDLIRWRARTKALGSDRVFRGKTSETPVYEAMVYKLRRAGVRAGIKRPLNLHLIRAGAATYLDGKGVGLAALKQLGRWKSVQALQRYLRADEAIIGDALAKVK